MNLFNIARSLIGPGRSTGMAFDIILQAILILASITFFLFMHNIPKKLLTKYNLYRNKTTYQSRSHFVQGYQLLSKARSSNSAILASQAVDQADQAITLNPSDAAAHILKSLALDFQGFKTSALDALNAALSPLCVKSLTQEERGDALFRRGELLKRIGRVDEAIDDLVESVKFSVDNKAEGFRLLGESYEGKGMKDEAKMCYEKAVEVKPELDIKEKLEKLGQD